MYGGGYYGGITWAGTLVSSTFEGNVPGTVCGGDSSAFAICADEGVTQTVFGAESVTNRVTGSQSSPSVSGSDSGHSVSGGDRRAG